MERRRFLEGVTAIAESVYSFHQRFDIAAIDTAEGDAAIESLRQRLALLAEETGEHARALNSADVAGAVDEAVDVAYVALGTVLCLGEAGRSASLAVARKNDAKTPSTHRRRSSTGKVLSSS